MAAQPAERVSVVTVRLSCESGGRWHSTSKCWVLAQGTVLPPEDSYVLIGVEGLKLET